MELERLVIDEVNEKRDEFIRVLVTKADIYEPVKQLVPVTLNRLPDDKDTDWIVCQIGIIYSRWEDIPVWESPKRKYKLIDWGWDKTTYGFLLEVIEEKPI